MFSLFRKYFRQTNGAVAVETAIITPILVFMLMPAIDLGLQIHTMQKMNKAADSGVEYLVNGGRNEAVLRNIVQDSFGGQISQSDLSVDAYCGCIVSDDTSDGGGQNSAPNPNAGIYVKQTTSISEDMCAWVCDDGSMPSALVNVELARNVTGLWKAKRVSAHLQTRVQ